MKELGYGHEIFNFQPFQGKHYGYGRAPKGTIRLDRIAAAHHGEFLDDVLVVWVARSLVIGWYEHARLYRKWQSPPSGAGRIYVGDPIGYYAVAKSSDCCLLAPDARTMRVPRAWEIEGGMGRYVWYAEGPRHREFLDQLKLLVRSKGRGTSKKPSHRNIGRQMDPRKRKLIEEAAIRQVIGYYQDRLQFLIADRQSENVGWDLEAAKDGVKLLLEEKGTSGDEVCAELSANEYMHMRSPRHRSNYRICIVSSALTSRPKLSIFSYRAESKCWVHHENDSVLTVEEKIVKIARLR